MSSDDKKKHDAASPGIDRELIRDLASLLTETGLSEIEVENGGLRVRVAKQLAAALSVPAAAPVAAPVPVAAAEAPVADAAAALKNAVTSPMVGTAYLAPEPGAAPFVVEGDQVREGQTLLIVEAMKTMNPIPAPRSGRVTRIMVEDAQPVEFGEPLLVIE